MKWRLDDGQIEALDKEIVEILRRKTPTERVQIALAAGRTVRLIVEGSVRTRHPDWPDARVQAEVARRMSRGSH